MEIGLGIVEKAYDLYLFLKQKKCEGILNIYTSILFDYKRKEIRICNDAGRATRPLHRIKDRKLLMDLSIVQKIIKNELVWDDLFINHDIDTSVLLNILIQKSKILL